MNDALWIIPWYREQDWPEWCSLCNFRGSHKDWLSRAEAGAKAQGGPGLNVVKVVIEPRNFLAWGRNSPGENGDGARMAYAMWLFAEREGADRT